MAPHPRRRILWASRAMNATRQITAEPSPPDLLRASDTDLVVTEFGELPDGGSNRDL